jgi:hypothetical protein
MDNNITCRHLEGHQNRLKYEEVPPSGEPECFISVPTGKANKRGRDGQISHHLRHAEGDGENDRAPQGESDEETRRTAIEESAADLDVECCADGAADARNCELAES